MVDLVLRKRVTVPSEKLAKVCSVTDMYHRRLQPSTPQSDQLRTSDIPEGLLALCSQIAFKFLLENCPKEIQSVIDLQSRRNTSEESSKVNSYCCSSQVGLPLRFNNAKPQNSFSMNIDVTCVP